MSSPLVLRDSFYADAVSRAYYAVLHAAKAALESQGITAESHAAVKRLFGRHLVQSGLLVPEWGSALGESLDMRLMAGYGVPTPVSLLDGEEAVESADAFLGCIRTYLIDNGYDVDVLD